MSASAPTNPEQPRAGGESIEPLFDTTVLGLDLGDARIGVAVKPAGQSMVLPIAVVEARPEARAAERLRQMIRERQVGVVVVGLPLNADPEQAKKVKRTVRKLRRGVEGVRWRFYDETLTSVAASEIGRDLGEGRNAKPDDDRAAALILESFLASAPRLDAPSKPSSDAGDR